MKLLGRIGILLFAAAVVIGGALLLNQSGLMSSVGSGDGPGGGDFDGGERPAFAQGGDLSAATGANGAFEGRPARGDRLAGGGGEFRGERGEGAFALSALLTGLLRNGAKVAIIALAIGIVQWLAGRLKKKRLQVAATS